MEAAARTGRALRSHRAGRPSRGHRRHDPNGTVSEHAIGAEVVRAALAEHLRWIATDAGHDGDAVLERVRTLSPGWGLDALTGEYGEMAPAGVIDAAKLT